MGYEVLYAGCDLLSILGGWSGGIRSREVGAVSHEEQRVYQDKPHYLHGAGLCVGDKVCDLVCERVL